MYPEKEKYSIHLTHVGEHFHLWKSCPVLTISCYLNFLKSQFVMPCLRLTYACSERCNDCLDWHWTFPNGKIWSSTTCQWTWRCQGLPFGAFIFLSQIPLCRICLLLYLISLSWIIEELRFFSYERTTWLMHERVTSHFS